MNLLQNIAITGRERVGSLVYLHPHCFVLSGLPLASFSSVITPELVWEKEERKTKKKDKHCWEPKKSSTNHGQDLDKSSILGQTWRTLRTVRGMEGSRWGREGEKDEAVQCCLTRSLYKQTGLLSVAVPATMAPLWGSRLPSLWMRHRPPIRRHKPAEFWIQTVFTKPPPVLAMRSHHAGAGGKVTL